MASEKDLLPVHHLAVAGSRRSVGQRYRIGPQHTVSHRRVRALPPLAITLALAQDSHLIGAWDGVVDEPVLDKQLTDQDPGDLCGGR